MTTPACILDIFGAIMILIAEASAAQLLAARAWTHRAGADIPLSHLLTAIALAGILVPGLAFLPTPAWETVFAALTAWFAWSLWRETLSTAAAPISPRPALSGRAAAMSRSTAPPRGPAAPARSSYAPHLIHAAAMLYVVATLPAPVAASSAVPSSGMAGMSGMAGGSSSAPPTPPVPLLALIFALLLIAYTVHALNRPATAAQPAVFAFAAHPAAAAAASPAAAAAATPAAAAAATPAAAPFTAERLLLSPAALKACQLTISVTIAFLLIVQ